MKKRLAGIADFVGKDIVIGIDRRPFDDLLLNGFIVGASEKLLLLHIVDGSTLLLNGYSVVRLSHIRSYRVDGTFVTCALRLLDRTPVIHNHVDLSDWPTFVASVNSSYPCLLIEMEKKEPGRGSIGRVANQTAKYVELEKVNPKGRWHKTQRFPFKDITQIEFDNGYVNALALLVAYDATT